MDAQITELKIIIEQLTGHPLKTSRDFEELHSRLLDSVPPGIGTTTLKRIWNYIDSPHELRTATLDVLCRYAGFTDWNTFLSDHCGQTERETSNFVAQQTLRAANLQTGQQVEIRWNPNRRLLALHKGGSTFEVLESENSKLTPGTTFRCERFIIGLPLFIDILRPDAPPALYQAGKKGGITKIKVIGDE